ncbi:MAG: hypothetical protein IPH38_18160 [Candidatus Microthrix sp.]|nr:hypothetical protein [Candidatus Microthrix sp.]MBK7021457.1 hypothetical protein [Candidatus Microthrix sp.]
MPSRAAPRPAGRPARVWDEAAAGRRAHGRQAPIPARTAGGGPGAAPPDAQVEHHFGRRPLEGAVPGDGRPLRRESRRRCPPATMAAPPTG